MTTGSATMGQDRFTLGEAAKLLDVPEWKLRRAFLAGRLREPARVGQFRALTPADLEAAREFFKATTKGA